VGAAEASPFERSATWLFGISILHYWDVCYFQKGDKEFYQSITELYPPVESFTYTSITDPKKLFRRIFYFIMVQ
jgi:hypothetical protein